jgi:protease I
MAKVLLIIGDAAEQMDTFYPYYRLPEDGYEVHVAAPEVREYHLVGHQIPHGWDVTREFEGYRLASDIAFRDVQADEYCGLVLPGGRAPEYLRYDQDLMRLTRHFLDADKPVACICHGIEIIAAADVIRGRRVTTIPKCRYDAEFSGAEYVDQPVVVDGNLVCAQGKANCSEWMRQFVPLLNAYRDAQRPAGD